MTRRVGSMLIGLCFVAVTAAAATSLVTMAVRSPSGRPSFDPRVIVEHLPAGALQPQVAVDAKGVVHLVYFQGKPEAGDLYYYHYPAGAGPSAASRPIRVNSQPQTAIAVGTIRTEQIAVGAGDRVHVVWNGLAPKEGRSFSPMYLAYARLDDTQTAFEPQRSLCQWTGNLDGGGCVAADRAGNVYAVWHTGPSDNTQGEEGRGVYLAVSLDEGKTFGRERQVNPEPTGACACCSMRAYVQKNGTLQILYRSAGKGGTERDTMLLTSSDKGRTFTLRMIDPWPVNACPMSSFSLAQDGETLLAAWETREQVFWAPIGSDGRPVRPGMAAPGVSQSKHPVILSNGRGQVLFAWTEGTGWGRGGSLGWQVYDASGHPLGARGHAEGLPAWSLLSAYVRPDGAFVLVR